MARTILAEHETQRIRDVVEGHVVKIVGRARPLDVVLRSPLTGRRCVHYHVRAVVEEQRGDRPGKRRTTIVRERESVELIVDDGSDRAIVRVDDVQVVTLKDVEGIYARGQDERVDALLRAHGRAPTRVEVHEGSIHVGERVAVVGLAHRIAAPEALASYRAAPEILELSAPPAHPLILSDDPETF